MSTDDTSSVPTQAGSRFDALTVVALGVLAYICSDLAHEVFGHGVGLFLAGGRNGVLTTTRLIFNTQLPDPGWRLFDIGGPAGNLAWAGICALLLRLLRPQAANLRLLLWTSMCISLFWEAGYLILSGVKGHGDWMALVDGLPAEWLGRSLLVIVGYVLFRLTGRLGMHFLRMISPVDGVMRLLVLLAAGGTVIAISGAFFDPRGKMEMLNSGALSMVSAWVGFLLISRRFAGPVNGAPALKRNFVLIVLALTAAIVYIALLGPGIPVLLGTL